MSLHSYRSRESCMLTFRPEPSKTMTSVISQENCFRKVSSSFLLVQLSKSILEILSETCNRTPVFHPVASHVSRSEKKCSFSAYRISNWVICCPAALLDLEDVVWRDVNWINLAHDRLHWRAFLNMAMTFGLRNKLGISWVAEWLLAF
jgi:hypothetical protein